MLQCNSAVELTIVSLSRPSSWVAASTRLSHVVLPYTHRSPSLTSVNASPSFHGMSALFKSAPALSFGCVKALTPISSISACAQLASAPEVSDRHKLAIDLRKTQEDGSGDDSSTQRQEWALKAKFCAYEKGHGQQQLCLRELS